MNEQKQSIELWKARQVQRVVGIGRTTLWQKSKFEDFPKPIKTGLRSIAWRSDEILEWIASRQRA